jgi:hypothetical protein
MSSPHDYPSDEELGIEPEEGTMVYRYIGHRMLCDAFVYRAVHTAPLGLVTPRCTCDYTARIQERERAEEREAEAENEAHS